MLAFCTIWASAGANCARLWLYAGSIQCEKQETTWSLPRFSLLVADLLRLARCRQPQEFVALNQMRNLVTDPNRIQINMRVVIPDWCTKRQGCAPADDCPFINAAVCSPGTCAEDATSFGCSCTAAGVESSGAPACGGRYAGDSCPTGCRMADPCRSIMCVNGSCSNGVCTCLPRFAPASPTVCVDVCNPSPCGAATCEYLTGSQFRCVCPAGTTFGNGMCAPDPAVCSSATCQGPTSKCRNDSCSCDTPFVLDSTKQKCVSPPTPSPTPPPTTSIGTTSTLTSVTKSTIVNNSTMGSAINGTASNASNVASNATVTSLGAESVGDSESTDSSMTVGIVAGVIAVLCVALIAAFACWWRAKSRSREPPGVTRESERQYDSSSLMRQPVYASARSDRFQSERVSTSHIEAPTPIYGAGPRIPTDVYGAAPRMPTEVFWIWRHTAHDGRC
jgi:hypothetical protein